MAESKIQGTYDTGWIRIVGDPDNQAKGIFLRRIGHTVYVQLCNFKVEYTSGTIVCTLPSWAFPVHTCNPFIMRSGTVYNGWINISGQFNIASAASGIEVGGFCTYCSAD